MAFFFGRIWQLIFISTSCTNVAPSIVYNSNGLGNMLNVCYERFWGLVEIPKTPNILETLKVIDPQLLYEVEEWEAIK